MKHIFLEVDLSSNPTTLPHVERAALLMAKAPCFINQTVSV
jgi:hypothetical protein